MPIKVFAYTPKPDKKASPAVLPPSPITQPAARQTPYDRILHLQRLVGNRSSGRLLRSGRPSDLDRIQSDGLRPAQTTGRPPGRILESVNSAHRNLQRSALKKYKRSRHRLNRQLAAINRITNPTRKKQRQIQFIQAIYRNIIGSNPFASIQVKKLRAWAETEWINPNRQGLGIKVVFSRDIFKQSLAKIIATAIHEATHAHQLKRGMNYYPQPGRLVGGRQLTYLETVRHFAEADANLETYSRFGAALNKTQIQVILQAITSHFQQADKNLSQMALSFYNRSAFRLNVTQLFLRPKLKHAKKIIKLWKQNKSHLGLKEDLLPWRKLP